METCNGAKRHIWNTVLSDRKGWKLCDCESMRAKLIGGKLTFDTSSENTGTMVKLVYAVSIEEE